MTEPVNSTFYLEPRFDGTAEAIIASYCESVRGVMRRLVADVADGATGEFGSGGHELMLAPLAVALGRTAAHPDLLERSLLQAPGEGGAAVRVMFANIVHDANLAQVNEAHAAAPKANEKKFDIQRGGWSLKVGKEFAEKFEKAFEATKNPILEPLAKLVNLIIVLMKDLGLVGEVAEEPAVNEIAKEVELKLDRIIADAAKIVGATDGLKHGQDGINDGINGLSQSEAHIASVTELTQTLVEEIWREVNRIESKADTLGSLLGQTLMSDPWIVDPQHTGGHVNRTPQRGVKEELHGIEDLLNLIVKLLGPITVDPIPKDPPPPDQPEDALTLPPPPPVRLPVLADPRLKKIFVYRRGRFTPTTGRRRRTIRVRTPAFDVSGWLDLTNLRPGDVIEVDVRVSVAGNKDLLYRRTRFDAPALLAMSDFAGGNNYLSGDDLSFVIKQTKSADAFATPIDLGYQFVVESA